MFTHHLWLLDDTKYRKKASLSIHISLDRDLPHYCSEESLCFRFLFKADGTKLGSGQIAVIISTAGLHYSAEVAAPASQIQRWDILFIFHNILSQRTFHDNLP